MNAKELKEKLCYQKKNGLLKVDDATFKAIGDYCEGYKKYLDDAKTEREAVKVSVALAEAKADEPSLIQKTVTNIKVAVPAPAIAIKTTVTGSGAESAGCKATPYNIASV